MGSSTSINALITVTVFEFAFYLYWCFYSLVVIIVAARRATSAKDNITTGESVKRSLSLLAQVTTAARKHTAALLANANHGRKPRSSVLLRGYYILLFLNWTE